MGPTRYGVSTRALCVPLTVLQQQSSPGLTCEANLHLTITTTHADYAEPQPTPASEPPADEPNPPTPPPQPAPHKKQPPPTTHPTHPDPTQNPTHNPKYPQRPTP